MRILIGLLIAPLFVCSCSHQENRMGSFTILTLKGPSAIGMIYLIDSPGICNGTPVRIEILDEPMQIRARMLKDKPEMVVLPLNMAAILYNKGLPYQIQAITGWGSLFLIGTDQGISGWDDLRGRKIYVMGRGATPDILLKFLLQVNGLQPGRDVDLDYSFPTHIDLANAVAAGQAHLAVLPEPSVSLVRSKYPEVRILMDLNREWSVASPEHPAIPQTALMIRQEVFTNDPVPVQTLLDRYRESIDSVNNDPEGAARKIAGIGILPEPAVAAAAIPGCNLEYRKALEVYPEIRNYLTILYKFRPVTVGGKIPDEGFIRK